MTDTGNIRIRAHAGNYADSMATERLIPATYAGVAAYLLEHLAMHAEPGAICVKPYAFDPRNQWSTYLVTVLEKPVAFTDGPVSR